MSDSIEIIVQYDIGKLSPNKKARMVLMQLVRIKNSAKAAAALAWRRAGSPVAPGPVTVDLTICRARRLDPGALIDAFKYCADQLFVKAITPDDSDRWLSYGEVCQEIARCWKGCEQVIVTIRPRANAEPSAAPLSAPVDRKKGSRR